MEAAKKLIEIGEKLQQIEEPEESYNAIMTAAENDGGEDKSLEELERLFDDASDQEQSQEEDNYGGNNFSCNSQHTSSPDTLQTVPQIVSTPGSTRPGHNQNGSQGTMNDIEMQSYSHLGQHSSSPDTLQTVPQTASTPGSTRPNPGDHNQYRSQAMNDVEMQSSSHQGSQSGSQLTTDDKDVELYSHQNQSFFSYDTTANVEHATDTTTRTNYHATPNKQSNNHRQQTCHRDEQGHITHSANGLNNVQQGANTSPQMKTTAKRKLVLVGTGLDQEAQKKMEQLRDLLNDRPDTYEVAITDDFLPHLTTHVVTKLDDPGRRRCLRTAKYLLGVVTGAFVVSIDWVSQSLEAGRIVDEKMFEVSEDTCGRHGAIRARKAIQQGELPLFYNYTFYIHGKLGSFPLKHAQTIIEAAGGTAVKSHPLLRTQALLPAAEEGQKVVVLAHKDSISDKSKRQLRLATRSPVVDISWLLECISYYEIRPFEDHLIRVGN